MIEENNSVAWSQDRFCPPAHDAAAKISLVAFASFGKLVVGGEGRAELTRASQNVGGAHVALTFVGEFIPRGK